MLRRLVSLAAIPVVAAALITCSDAANGPLGHVGEDPSDLKFNDLWQQDERFGARKRIEKRTTN